MKQPPIDIPVRAPAATSADDTVLPFEIAALDLRGRVVRLGLGHQPRIDLIRPEQVVPQRAILVAHRHPGVGDHAIRPRNRLLGVVAEHDVRTAFLDPRLRARIGRKLRRRCDPQLELEPLGGMHP
jgi:hypothetical protein